MFGLGLVAKGVKAVAAGGTQRALGAQSPYLPGALTRIGRFLYGSTGVLIGITWYVGYANARTATGDGPSLVLPGKPKVNTVDRPDRSPKFVGGGASSGQSSPATAQIAGAPNIRGALPGAKAAYPGPAGRTDQGVDFATPGPVLALANGKVLTAGLWHGWPGTDGIVYSTPYGNVYVMEHFQRAVNPKTGRPYAVGDTVTVGQEIGQALRGYPWIETGLANAAGSGPLTPYGGSKDGTPMPGGLAFRKLLGY